MSGIETAGRHTIWIDSFFKCFMYRIWYYIRQEYIWKYWQFQERNWNIFRYYDKSHDIVDKKRLNCKKRIYFLSLLQYQQLSFIIIIFTETCIVLFIKNMCWRFEIFPMWKIKAFQFYSTNKNIQRPFWLQSHVFYNRLLFRSYRPCNNIC